MAILKRNKTYIRNKTERDINKEISFYSTLAYLTRQNGNGYRNNSILTDSLPSKKLTHWKKRKLIKSMLPEDKNSLEEQVTQ